MGILDDFFGESDRRTELGRNLIASLESRFSFGDARKILNGGKVESMTGEEVVMFLEWKPLDDAEKENIKHVQDAKVEQERRRGDVEEIMKRQEDEYQP